MQNTTWNLLLYTIYTAKFTLFLYLNSHSLPMLTCSISDTSKTCLKIHAPALSMKCTIYILSTMSIHYKCDLTYFSRCSASFNNLKRE